MFINENLNRRILSLLCLMFFLGLQTNLSALFFSFEEKHQVSFSQKGEEYFLVLEHEKQLPQINNQAQSDHSKKEDHFIRVNRLESYQEASFNVNKWLLPILLRITAAYHLTTTFNSELLSIHLIAEQSQLKINDLFQLNINFKNFIELLIITIFLRL